MDLNHQTDGLYQIHYKTVFSVIYCNQSQSKSWYIHDDVANVLLIVKETPALPNILIVKEAPALFFILIVKEAPALSFILIVREVSGLPDVQDSLAAYQGQVLKQMNQLNIILMF